MPKKRHVSVRFKDISSDARMTTWEWERFKRLADYFDVSDDTLVEAALRYRRYVQKKIDIPQQMEKNNGLFDELFVRYPALKCLLTSLCNGFLDKKVILSRGNNEVYLPAGIEVRYYPPYLLSLEVSHQIRMTLDLTQPFSISHDESKITIEV